jgi:hypothetical protein
MTNGPGNLSVTNPPMLWITLLKVQPPEPQCTDFHGFLGIAQDLGICGKSLILLEYEYFSPVT